MKPERTTVLVLCAAASGLLLYALLGEPSYGYFGFMKIAVCAAALYVAWALHQRSPRLAPLSLVLGALGLLEMFGKMRREDWAPWNWATVAAFALAGAIGIWRTKDENEEAD